MNLQMKNLFAIVAAAFFLILLVPSPTSAQGTFYCDPDTLNGGCKNNCTDGYTTDCEADTSGYAACLGPYTETTCVENPYPQQSGECPDLCVNVGACLQVVPGYAGKCGAGRECCKASLPGGNPEKGGSKGLTPSLETCGLRTAIGCVPVEDPNDFAKFVLRWGVGVGGGVAFLLIVVAGFQIMTSTGNPEKLKAGQDKLTSAVMGLILLIASVVILRIIGVDILKIPGIF